VVASRTERARQEADAGFNPLHCGAVVASRNASSTLSRGWGVSIPFIAGQWSLPSDEEVRVQLRKKVSIPFIAGQWSLRARAAPGRRRRGRVSIPFIAGQWSLHEEVRAQLISKLKSQSPSLRGSGRFLLL